MDDLREKREAEHGYRDTGAYEFGLREWAIRQGLREPLPYHPGTGSKGIDWNSQPLGQVPDKEIADRVGVSVGSVQQARSGRGIPAYRAYKRWTKREKAMLKRHFDRYGGGRIELIAAKLGRSEKCCLSQMCNFGFFSKRKRSRGLVWPKTLNQIVNEWGYSRSTIVTAAKRLSLTFQRRTRARTAPYLITREQAEQLKVELRNNHKGEVLNVRKLGEWGPGEACVDCGRSSVKRHALDRCNTCYLRHKAAKKGNRG